MSYGQRFEKLLQPGRIGNLEIKNRFVVPPIATNLATPDGFVTEKMKAYYAERAKGGFGLVIVEVCCVQPPVGKTIARQLNIDDDKYIAGLAELVKVIKANGARAGLQVHHAGRAAKMRFTHMQPVAPSPLPEPPWPWGSPKFGDTPRELTIAEIEDLVERYAAGALRAVKAGFELVEVHGATGYLVAQFLSAGSNHRQDRYGGELRNRARFAIEIATAIRKKIGKDFPFTFRLNGREFGVEGGFTLAESKQTAQWLQEAGINAIHQSAFLSGVTARTVPPMEEADGSVVRLAAGLKEAVTIPVMATGRMTPVVGERLLSEGGADFVSIGRGSLADPHIPNKVALGRAEDIRMCISCLHCVWCVLQKDADVACAVNAVTGHEHEYKPGAAARGKRVVVVGAGPAGLEAARVAASREHQVTILEKGQKVGGQLLLAAAPPHKSRVNLLTEFLERQVKQAGVDIITGKEATVQQVLALKPDAVVVATGVKPLIPELPGVNGSNVVTAEDVITGKAKVGSKVVILGGELVGCETAEMLADQGKVVTVTRRGPKMAAKMNPSLAALQLARLEAKGVKLLPGVKYHEITAKGLIVTNAQGQKQTLEADTIVLAAGSVPQPGLAHALRGKVAEVYTAGDCVEARSIADAVADGARVGYSL